MDHGLDGLVQARAAALDDIGCQGPGAAHKPQHSRLSSKFPMSQCCTGCITTASNQMPGHELT